MFRNFAQAIVGALAMMAVMAVMAVPAMADEDKPFLFGGDEFVGGNQLQVAMPVANDLFAMGFRLNLNQPVGGDVHAGGFALNMSRSIGGNVYAMGNDIEISGKVGADISAAGNSIRVSGAEGVGGNVRLAGASVTLTAPVAGAAMIAAGEATLDGVVSGDFSFTGQTLNFGDQARILGAVTIYSPNAISVPTRVASADRVRVVKTEIAEMHEDEGGYGMMAGGYKWWGALVMAVALLVLGFAWLALFPTRSRMAYETAMTRTGTSVLAGIGGLAALIGLIPLLGVTFVGILIIPFAIVFLVLSVLIGYVAGGWFLGLRVMEMFGGDAQSGQTRTLALLIGVIGAMILCLIPFIGWLTQLAFVIFGLGGIFLAALTRWSARAATADSVEPPKN